MAKISRFNIAAVIFDKEGKVLLCKRSMKKKIAPGKWRLPGGRIEIGETPLEALKRELLEELSVEAVSISEMKFVYTYRVGEETHQTQYAQVVIKGDIRLNYENDDYEYVSKDNMARYVEDEHLLIQRKAIGW